MKVSGWWGDCGGFLGGNEGGIVLVIPGSSSTHQQRISVRFRTACFGGEEKVTIRREEHLGWDHFGIMEDVVDKHPVFASFFSIIFFHPFGWGVFHPLTNWEQKKIMRVANLGIFPFKKWPSTILGIFGINGSGGCDHHLFGRQRNSQIGRRSCHVF